jgi:hypothetical protein
MNSSPEKLISVPIGSSCSFCNRNSRVMVGILSFVMSGLLGLFVGKQKATTDAPDTYTA